ncbi:alpha/beta hydrolase [Salirhabdus sp. Marseille-P4669]|uniref:alpha/beta hydrolase n=1 Tax=Salirhabdus sp. Marseille-P4669 TaxID=2042310 RepID=UPI000C7DEBF4|nr:alpha/beta hydrolase [Salirhabdus sp. Marseille-P4669]
MNISKGSTSSTIQKTLMTARLFDGFWDRWIAHGIRESDCKELQSSLVTVEDWINGFSRFAKKYHDLATEYEQFQNRFEAEKWYRLTALYYNLMYWVFPDRSEEKKKWYQRVKEYVGKADQLSAISYKYDYIEIDGVKCVGRIRIPDHSKGCIVIINPIDSAKEELYTYENHFIQSHYTTVSFDGPGQGETYLLNGLKATQKRWETFVHKVIDFAASHFINQPIYLFGTSSGAAWSIYGSEHPKVERVVAVSPPIMEVPATPNYFTDRLALVMDKEAQSILPNLNTQSSYSSIFLFHGKKDVMVSTKDMHYFYERLLSPKMLVEYPEEGHCCNFKLHEVRDLAMEWFEKGDVKHEF